MPTGSPARRSVIPCKASTIIFVFYSFLLLFFFFHPPSSFFFKAARAAISGTGDSGAGAPLTSPPPTRQEARPAAAALAPAPGVEGGGGEEWVGEKAVMADAIGAKIEGALGAVMEHVRRGWFGRVWGGGIGGGMDTRCLLIASVSWWRGSWCRSKRLLCETERGRWNQACSPHPLFLVSLLNFVRY